MRRRIKDAFSVILGNALVHYQSPKHHPEAKQLFEDVLSRNDSYGSALVGLGLILEEQQDYDGALEFLEKALKNNEEDVKIRSEVAWVKVLMERYDEGLKELEGCLELVTGKDAASRDLRAQIFWRIGQGLWNSDVEGRADPEKARAFFVKAIQQNQNFAPAYTSLGIFFADVSEDIDRANKCFQRAFELSAGEVEAAERLARNFAESREWELVEIVARRVAQAEKKRSVPGKGVSWPQAAIGVVELVSIKVSTIWLITNANVECPQSSASHPSVPSSLESLTR
jgi:superkiller protein 3